MQYRVTETETWLRETWVEADSPEEAVEKVRTGGETDDVNYIGDTDEPFEVYDGTTLVATIPK